MTAGVGRAGAGGGVAVGEPALLVGAQRLGSVSQLWGGHRVVSDL
jgi:hypothetical protein